MLRIGLNQRYREYKLGREIIASSNVERDLGILVDNKVSWTAVLAKDVRVDIDIFNTTYCFLPVR